MKNNAIKIAGYVIVIGIVLLVYFLTKRDGSDDDQPVVTPSELIDVSDFNHQIEDTTKRNVPSDPSMMTGYGLRLYEWNGKFISTESLKPDKDNQLQVVVSLANATDIQDRVGLLLFLDGKLQQYRVDNSEDKTYLYTQSMPSKSVLNVPITLETETTAVAKRELFIVLVNRMDELPGEKQPHVGFFTLSMQKAVQSPTVSKSAEQPDLSFAPVKPIPSTYTGSLDVGNVSVALSQERSEISFIQLPSLALLANESTKLVLRGTGEPGQYATVLFRNHEPVPFENSLELYWEIKEKEMLDTTISLPAEAGTDPSQYYMITVPLNAQFPFIVSSPKAVNAP
ncbi:hypothetical protein I6N90_00410 [Paenibacillus sp. GSMTC-2017]|uniref:hypothetical protein n=1 Tax=Paenibacillus sp. GSMTC-2017 TaxID=2794350 RepID=UPI0018D76F14|nr:hypothetical protein [Paenibacillus sp. GSMTC-2017]MBH5316269.1 hypothetical protein [Paenibacillus sp. GSMTC-2017]